MSREKKKPVMKAQIIMFTVLPTDAICLHFYENKIGVESNRGRLEIPDSEIIRHVLHRAYEADRNRVSARDFKIMEEADIPMRRK